MRQASSPSKGSAAANAASVCGGSIRWGTAVEVGLRHWHRQVAGGEAGARAAKQGPIFQRLVDQKQLVKLLSDDCGYDPHSNPDWLTMRELMADRHLYAHRSGLIDARYITDVSSLTGQDLLPSLELVGYPGEEVYFFKPLRRLPEYVEAARSFVSHLPIARSTEAAFPESC